MSETLAERVAAEMPHDLIVVANRNAHQQMVEDLTFAPRFAGDAIDAGASTPRAGLLSSRLMFAGRNMGVVQHSRSTEELHAYDHRSDGKHLAAWKRVNNRVGTRGDADTWHETHFTPPTSSRFISMSRRQSVSRPTTSRSDRQIGTVF